MMSGGIAGRIGFRFHNAAAEPARGEIMDDDFSDEKTSQPDGFGWKFGAQEAPDLQFLRRAFQIDGRWWHGISSR